MIPDSILQTDRWLIWRYEQRSGEKKPTKVPYIAGRPADKASSIDPSTWNSFEVAQGNAEDGKANGVGFALGDGWAGVDFDDCRDPDTGEVQGWALAYVRELDSYTEVSPSGTGLKTIVRGVLPPKGRRKGKMGPAEDGVIEMYDSGRYFAITGQHFEGTPTTIEDRTDELARVHASVFGKAEPELDAGPPPPAPAVPLDLSDSEIISRACASKNGPKFAQLWNGDITGYTSHSEADQALANLLAFWCGRDIGRMDALFRQSGLMRPKWDSPRNDSTYGADTLKLAAEGCRETYSPHIAVTIAGAASGTTAPAAPNGNGGTQAARAASIQLEDFWAYMPQHEYVFAPSREMWPAASVNSRFVLTDALGNKIKASAWLDQNRPVEQMTWAPGQPGVVENRLISHGGWIERPGCNVFNLYLPPTVEHGDAGQAGPWMEHVERVYPAEAEHIIRWLAHRVQRPAEKINHGLLLIGDQGIGKDTLLEPAKHAVGPWNFKEISPTQLLGRFNGFVKSVILRISEARDLGGDGQELSGKNRYGFYEHLKTYTAAPPDVLRVDEKNIREYSVLNVTGVVITTNHRDGVYLPADDRRIYVAESELTKQDFTPIYWANLHRWYHDGGHRHVAAYLAELDISDFDAKAPPPKTTAFWNVVESGRAPEDAELADALEDLGHPEATTLNEIIDHATAGFAEWLRDRKNSRQVPHRLLNAGYIVVRSDGRQDGRWRIGGRRHVVYARRDLSVRERVEAAQRLSGGLRWTS